MTLRQTHGWMMALLSVAAGISLGVTLRAADASASDGERCFAEIEAESWGRLVEVRRIAGSGSLDSQSYWGDRVILRARGPSLNSFDGSYENEFRLELDPESEP